MPLVRRFVSELFGCTEFEETRGALRLGTEYSPAGRAAVKYLANPDEAVGVGRGDPGGDSFRGFRSVYCWM